MVEATWFAVNAVSYGQLVYQNKEIEATDNAEDCDNDAAQL